MSFTTDFIKEAIREKKSIQFRLKSDPKNAKLREINPYFWGFLTSDNEGTRAYQVSGYTSSELGWKLFLISDMEKVDKLVVKFKPREDYSPTDKDFKLNKDGEDNLRPFKRVKP